MNCGTKAGYMEHRRRKQPACTACKKAWNDYYRAYRAGLKEKAKRDYQDS